MAIQIFKGEKFYPAFQEGDTSVSAVKYGVVRLSDGYYYDFADSTFKASGWTTQFQTMTEQSNGLWVHTSGWTSPSVKGGYRIQYQVTDTVGTSYMAGETIDVTDIAPQVITTSTPATTTQGMLDSVNAAISARLSGGGVQSYSIGGRNLQYISLTELVKLRDRLISEVSDTKGARNFAGFARPT